MDTFTSYLFLWNSWIILPSMAVAAAVAYWRIRKPSIAVAAMGLVLMIAGEGLSAAFPQPSHWAYLGGVILSLLGVVVMIGGTVWYVRKDSRLKRTAG